MSDWWSRKLGVDADPEPAPDRPEHRPHYRPTAQVHPPSGKVRGTDAVVTKDNISEHLADPSNYNNVRLRSVAAGETSHCPACGSGNYFSRGEAKPHCFECGWPVDQGVPPT